jgi:hypothetical protein
MFSTHQANVQTSHYAREKETIMKRVSLKAKVPALCVLGALSATFLLSPLAAFAGCGAGPAAEPLNTLKMKSVEKFSECSNRPLSTTQAPNEAGAQWLDEEVKPPTTQSAKATVGNGVTTAAPAAPPPPPAAPKPLTPEQLKAITFLSGSASCSFTAVDKGAKVNLSNGDVFLATLSSAKVSNQPVFGMLIGGKLVLFTSDKAGNRFTSLVQNPKVKLPNITLNKTTAPAAPVAPK